MAARRGAITGPVRLVVAARQQWRCSGCNDLLPAAFEVDHTVALVDGGADSAANVTAMCANCHAEKTQREHIERRARSTTAAAEYDAREDVYRDGIATCTRCRKQRAAGAPHTVCWAIERSAAPAPALASSLARFAFSARAPTRFHQLKRDESTQPTETP